MIRTALLTVGDELLIGQVVDTNSSWMAQELDKEGFVTVSKSTCSDDEGDIVDTLNYLTERADFVIITGGLGPTSDDRTRFALAKFLGKNLIVSEEALSELRRKYSARNRELVEKDPLQTQLPEGSEYVHNSVGTACGIWAEKAGKYICCLPGVPREMKVMFKEEVLKRMKLRGKPLAKINKVVMTATLPESQLSEKIKVWEERLPEHIKLAYLPSEGSVRLRLSGISANRSVLETELLSQVDQLRAYIKPYIFAYEDKPLNRAVGELLKERKETLMVAESCTGGYIQHLMTLEPGSSVFMKGGVTSYANEVKMGILGVRAKTLESYGAVSEQTVIEMAEGVRELGKSTWGIATSGVAGPSGGTTEKPVGTVWVAVSGPKGTTSKLLTLTQDRELNIKLASTYVMFLLFSKMKEG